MKNNEETQNKHDLSYLDNDKTQENVSKTSLYLGLALILGLVIMSCYAISRNNSSSTKEYKDVNNTTYSNTPTTEETSETEEYSFINLVDLDVKYNGSRKAGTVLNNSNEGIIVTATYDDDFQEVISTSECHFNKTVKLKAGKTSVLVIEYGGKKCKLRVKCPLSKKQYKQKCKTISYKKLARSPKKYDGKKVKFTGKIIQVIEDDYTNYYRINVTKDRYGFWQDTVFVEFEPTSSKRFLEDDIVTFYGTYDGLQTYESILGASVTIPSVIAKYMNLH